MAGQLRIERRAVHGVLLLDKPVGLSSNAALQQAKRLYRAEKAGHTGTLDPLASGLLPLCFGAATKFAQASLEADKGYRATLRLGITTTTGDAEGEVRSRSAVAVSRIDVESACLAQTGAIRQVPPMHSALKHAGKPLYQYARDGVEIERAPREVVIRSIEIVDGCDDLWTLDVRCSKGTYIRTLAEDIGAALGCGAHLAALRRTSSGALSVQQACPLETLETLDDAGREARLLPADALLDEWPQVRLDAEDAARFLAGLPRRVTRADSPQVRVYGPEPGALLGSASIRSGELVATRLLSTTEADAMVAAAPPVPQFSTSLFR